MRVARSPVRDVPCLSYGKSLQAARIMAKEVKIMRAIGKLAIAAVVLLPSATRVAADGENLEMGRMIADEYCSRCHNIEPDGPYKLETPSFAAIAKFRSKEQIRNRIVLPLHVRMPRFTEYMIGGNIDDMVAYIVSLEN